jgi:alkane 1-monooxygenase
LPYLAPIAGFWGIWQGGWASPGSVYIAFFLIPALEQLLPRSAYNLSSEEETQQAKNRFFDWLLYLHIPVLYGLIAYALHTQATQDRALWELAAMWLNVGLVVGAFGINVAHELGHRPGLAEQTMAKILLLPALYMHFFIEHNRGHHKNVATGEDPASARKGEVLYAFWLRSVWGELPQCLETGEKRNAALPTPSSGLSGGNLVVLPMGRTIFRHREDTNPCCPPIPGIPTTNWGRIFLYELTRHSDHHYKATRKYQVLRHWDDSPQLPYGYPTSILMALVPPLWFRVMDPLVSPYS